MIKFYENGGHAMDGGHCWKHTTPPFLTNSRVDMVGFVNVHKVVVRSAFLAFSCAWNGVELEGGIKNKRLKCQFSQVEKDLDLQ